MLDMRQRNSGIQQMLFLKIVLAVQPTFRDCERGYFQAYLVHPSGLFSAGERLASGNP